MVKRDALVRENVMNENAVRTAMEWNVLIPRDRVQVTVEGGWVTLAGEVEAQDALRRARLRS